MADNDELEAFLVGAGVSLLAVLYTLVWPLFRHNKWVIDLKRYTDTKTVSAKFFSWFGTNSSKFVVMQRPDDKFITDYVYGQLPENMQGIHTAAHYISSSIFEKPQVVAKGTAGDVTAELLK